MSQRYRHFIGLGIALWHALALFTRCDGATGAATQPAGPFTIVMIDAKTEAALGPFPYDRAILAKAVDRAAMLHAKGVVLKFFLDQPKSEQDDRALAASMQRIKVVLEARLLDGEPHPNELPPRFHLGVASAEDYDTMAAASGWLPIALFADKAHDIGFVDYQVIDRAPMLERYRGNYVKSLYTCCLELAMEEPAKTMRGNSFQIGDHILTLDKKSQASVMFPANDELKIISFIDFISGSTAEDLTGRVVIIGWDGKAFPRIQTPVGKITPHRAFCYVLLSLYDQLCRHQ